MLRPAAIRALLEDVAGLRRDAERDLDERLDRAARRARGVVALSWSALAGLVLMRQIDGRVFDFTGEQAVVSFALLAVAVYSGFRLGQAEKLRAVRRALEEVERWDGE